MRVYAQDKAGKRPGAPSGAQLRSFVAEEKLIALLMKNPDSYDRVERLLSPDDFQSEENRAIYAAVAGRLAQNQTPELIYLSAVLEPPLMSRLTGLVAEHRDIAFLPGQAEEYCAAILSGGERLSRDKILDMTPQEIQRSLRKQKGNPQ